MNKDSYPTPFDMQQTSDEESYPSSSISPDMEKDTIALSYASSQNTDFYMASQNNLPNFECSTPSYYSSGSNGHGSLMHPPDSPLDGSTFINTSSMFTTTPSPTSSMSSAYNTVCFPNGIHYGDMAYTADSNGQSSNSSQIMENFSAVGTPSHVYGTLGQPQIVTNEEPNYMKHNKHWPDHTHQEKEHKAHKRHKHSKQAGKRTPYTKTTSREKAKKKCSNCQSVNSPSWRRSIAASTRGNLLCNACGLYEKTAKKKRMLVKGDDGSIKVVRKRESRDYCCSVCGVRDVARWRRQYDNVICERCARGQRSAARI